jgi:hypothetical protein
LAVLLEFVLEIINIIIILIKASPIPHLIQDGVFGLETELLRGGVPDGGAGPVEVYEEVPEGVPEEDPLE